MSNNNCKIHRFWFNLCKKLKNLKVVSLVCIFMRMFPHSIGSLGLLQLRKKFPSSEIIIMRIATLLSPHADPVL